jgi:tetratricopeptide (TPR) repeat protein
MTNRPPVASLPRLARSVAAVAGGLLVAAVLAAVLAASAAAQPGGVPQDDPFADELNPFGPGPGRPAAPAQPPREAAPPRPAPQIPVPFPEATIPGEAAAPGGRDSAGRGRRPTAVPERGSLEASPAESLLVEAEALDRAGKFAEARVKLEEAIKKDPKLPIAYLALGVVARRLGDFEGSVDALSKGLQLDPQDPEMYLRRGIAWFHLGLYGIALEDFEEAASPTTTRGPNSGAGSR